MSIRMLFVLSVLSCFLVGCGDKDDEYYINHIDKAQEKMNDCEKQMTKAFTKRDKAAIEKIRKNTECQSARDAIMVHQRIELEKKQQEKEAKEKAELAAAREAAAKEYGKQTWQQYIVTYANSDCAESFFTKNNKCQAMEEIYKDKFQQGKDELYQIPFEKLSLAEDTYCKQDKRRYSACQIWKEVVDKQEKEIVENYVKNYAALKTDYNQCVDKVIATENQPQSWKLITNIRDSYPCKQTIKARQQLQLGYGLDNKKME